MVKHRITDTRLRDDLLSWLREVEAAQALRSRIIHAHWLIDETAADRTLLGRLKTTSRRGEFKFESEDMDASALHTAAEEIRSVGQKFMPFLNRLIQAGVAVPNERSEGQ